MISPEGLDVALLKEFHRLPSSKAKRAAIEIVRVFSETLDDLE